ncbi:hypothetical protein FF100_31665 [Methylobacterium terricola]|uniref:Uncharacterized protein n=1 Tax=Methylobacterium terricola TaxID=2583531 RepID=A0A5C4L7U2_9HYPH|nr:hypothetical protein [Methylobacterium terricola]TNC07641.1 hypothetical protein FF100_31665 [Methylobacterium terricola]
MISKTKPAIKNKSRRMNALKNDLDHILIEGFPEVNRTLLDSADKFLQNIKEIEGILETFGKNPIGALKQSSERVKKISERDHIKAVAFAYSLWLKSAHNEGYKKFLQEAWSARAKADKRTTSLHLLVESCISYGDPGPKSRNKVRGLYNRDVCAIKYLHSEGIGPDDMADLFKKTGEGLDKWSRKWYNSNRKENSAPKNPAKNNEFINFKFSHDADDSKMVFKTITMPYNDKSKKLVVILEGLIHAFLNEYKVHSD